MKKILVGSLLALSLLVVGAGAAEAKAPKVTVNVKPPVVNVTPVKITPKTQVIKYSTPWGVEKIVVPAQPKVKLPKVTVKTFDPVVKIVW